MTKLTDETKISKVNAAFAAVAQEYIIEGANKKAMSLVAALGTLGPDSKIKLFDILNQKD